MLTLLLGLALLVAPGCFYIDYVDDWPEGAWLGSNAAACPSDSATLAVGSRMASIPEE
ncbi:hypothetical protein GGR26_000178 [Lewinella marina]|nr:hypothetical protein [Neolewinella marina]NJB84433.1 hypothetical protein [Neolewinella marina]